MSDDNKTIDLAALFPKWKGVDRLADELCEAIFYDDSDVPSVGIAAVKLRERLEPLLEAAERVQQMATEFKADFEIKEGLAAEVAKWR